MAGVRDTTVLPEVESSDAFKTLAKLVLEDGPTVENAVQQLCEPAEARIPLEDNLEAPVQLDSLISLSVLELSQRHDPSRHAKLVEFMYQLHKRPAVDLRTGRPAQFHEGKLWTDLPSFAYSQLEAWWEHGGNYEDDIWGPDMNLERKHRWANLAAFLARLTQASHFRYRCNSPAGPITQAWRCPIDESTMMIRTIKLAFEEQGLEEVPGADPKVLITGAVDTAVVWAACECFLHAAGRLWAHVQNGLIWEDPGSVGPGCGYTSKGWRGFERERWDTWEQWLRDLEKACDDEDKDHSESRRRIRGALQSIQDAKEGKVGVITSSGDALEEGCSH